MSRALSEDRRGGRWSLGEGGRLFALGVLLLAVPPMVDGLLHPWGYVLHRPESRLDYFVQSFGFAAEPIRGLAGVIAVTAIIVGAILVIVLDLSRRALRRIGALAIVGGAILGYALFATIHLESIAPWSAFPDTPRCRDPVWSTTDVLIDEGVDGDCKWVFDMNLNESGYFSSAWKVMAGSVIAGALGLLSFRRLNETRAGTPPDGLAGPTEVPEGGDMVLPASRRTSDASILMWVGIAVAIGLVAYVAFWLWALSQMEW